MRKDILIAIICGIISNLITLGLIKIVRWRLLELGGDFSAVKAKLSLWFAEHLKGILITGVSLEVFLLAWVLVKFPTVQLWTVFVIIFCVVSMAFQIGVYLLIKTIESFLKALFQLGKQKAPVVV